MSRRQFTIRGENPQEILKLVASIETSSTTFGQHVNKSIEKPNGWYKYDSGWLIGNKCKPNSLIKIIRLLLSFNLKMAYAEYMKACFRAELPVYAGRIKIKNNIIAIYPGLNLVFKCQKPKSLRDEKSLLNEYKTLKTIESCSSIRGPVALGYESSSIEILWLNYVENKSQTNLSKEEVEVVLVEKLIDFYKWAGIKIIKASDFDNLVNIVKNGVVGLERLGWSGKDANLIFKYLNGIVQKNQNLVFSKVHGDASVGNILNPDKSNFIVGDWENSRFDLVAFDVAKLVEKNSMAKRVYVDWRGGLTENGCELAEHELSLTKVISSLNLNLLALRQKNILNQSDNDIAKIITARRLKIISICNAV